MDIMTTIVLELTETEADYLTTVLGKIPPVDSRKLGFDADTNTDIYNALRGINCTSKHFGEFILSTGA